jgi:hypothetical protein
MKKVLFLLFVLISITAKGQQASNTQLGSDADAKSIIVQKMDSSCCNETTNIKNHLTDFYRANRKSQLFMYGGALLSVAGALMNGETDKVNPIPIFGGICSLIGGVIYLDSFKFLNMNKKKKSKTTRTGSNSSNAYDFY